MPLRILHLADSHIGADLPARRRHGRPRRGDDFIRSYHRVLDLAYQYNVDAVIHAGDLFDSPRPTTDALWAATAPLRALADNGIPVVVIPGNHERSVLPAALMLNHALIHVLGCPRTIRLATQHGTLAVTGLPYQRRPTAGEFQACLAQSGWQEVDADARILVTHQALDSAVCGLQNYRFRLGGDDVVARNSVPSAFDYVAAGHIHRQQRLKPTRRLRPAIVYAGSSDRITFAESGEPKGAMIVDFDGGFPQYQFIEHQVRPMVITPLAVSGWSRDKLLERIEALVRDLPRDAVVQFRLTGVTEPAALARLNLPQRAFTWRDDTIFSYTIRGVEFETNRQRDPDVARYSESKPPTRPTNLKSTEDKIRRAIDVTDTARSASRHRIDSMLSATPATVKRLPTTCGIYFFFDLDHRLLYVGKALNLRARVQSHFRGPPGNFFANWALEVATIRALGMPDEQRALQVEATLIDTLRPPFNIAGRIQPTAGSASS